MTQSDKDWLLAEFKRVHDKFEYLSILGKRVRELEKQRWRNRGITITLSLILPTLVSIFTIYFYLKSAS